MISKKGVELIKSFEGFAPLEYTCVAGKRTIGYGHVLGPEEKYVCGVCEREAERTLPKKRLKSWLRFLCRTARKTLWSVLFLTSESERFRNPRC